MYNASVFLDTHHNVGPIDRRIFGGFLEHLGRAVYEGVYQPGTPLADEDGFRHDVIDTLKQLRMPVVRYPGGNFVSSYIWQDGVGPKEKRPRRPDYAWKSIESNQFGTDEFMKWCAKMGTKPMLAVNLGTRGTEEAAAYLEYCNLPAGTYWADQRKANGHAEPYGAKLWCLGNELDGPWQAGHTTAVEYARRAWQTSKLMKGLDPTIETAACGSSARTMATYMEWDRVVVEEVWDTADYISAHRYSRNDQNDTPWFLAEGVEIERVIDDYRGLLDYVRGLKKNDKRMYVSFDEWNVWYRARGGIYADGNWKEAPHLLEEVYNLEDALVCAQYLNTFIRNADIVKVACIAQIVNVIAPIMTRTDGILVQSIFVPMQLMSQHTAGISLRPAIDCPTYKAGARGDAPSLDASSSYDPQTGETSIFLVNRKTEDPASVTIKLDDRAITKITVAEGIGGVDPKLANSWEKPTAIQQSRAESQIRDGSLVVHVKNPGFVAVKVATAAR